MKKIFYLAGCTSILLYVCLSQSVLAAEKFGIGANISYMGVADTGPDDAIHFDGVSLIGLNATAQINRLLSLAVDVGYSQFNVDTSTGGVAVKTGELEQIPLLLTARIHIPIFKQINPYLGAGIGYYFNEFDSTDFLALAGGKIKADDNFAFHINGGIELLFGDRLALNLDMKYLWNEADLSDPASLLDDDLEMRTFIAGVGFKFYF